MQKRCRVSLHGHVHGVGMRVMVAYRAHRDGLGGWVKNQDKNVLMEIQGEINKIDEFLDWLKTSPVGVVESIEVSDIPLANEDKFKIKYPPFFDRFKK